MQIIKITSTPHSPKKSPQPATAPASTAGNNKAQSRQSHATKTIKVSRSTGLSDLSRQAVRAAIRCNQDNPAKPKNDQYTPQARAETDTATANPNSRLHGDDKPLTVLTLSRSAKSRQTDAQEAQRFTYKQADTTETTETKKWSEAKAMSNNHGPKKQHQKTNDRSEFYPIDKSPPTSLLQERVNRWDARKNKNPSRHMSQGVEYVKSVQWENQI